MSKHGWLRVILAAGALLLAIVFVATKPGQPSNVVPVQAGPQAASDTSIPVRIDSRTGHLAWSGNQLRIDLDEGHHGLGASPLVFMLPNADDGPIEAAAVDRDGWVWVRGAAASYVIPIQRDGGGYQFGSTRSLDVAFANPCSVLARALHACRPATSIFSQVSGRVFVTGFRSTVLGSGSRGTYEVVAGNFRSVTDSRGRPLDYMGDSQVLRAAVLAGRDDSLFLYNGSDQVQLLLPARVPASADYPSWILYDVSEANRAFVASNPLQRQRPYFYEVLAGGEMRSVAIPASLTGWIAPVAITTDGPMWLFTRHDIFQIVEGRAQLVATFPAPAFVRGPADIGPVGDAVRFSISGVDRTIRSCLMRAGEAPACEK